MRRGGRGGGSAEKRETGSMALRFIIAVCCGVLVLGTPQCVSWIPLRSIQLTGFALSKRPKPNFLMCKHNENLVLSFLALLIAYV